MVKEFLKLHGEGLGVHMLEAETYRQYAADCARIAAKMDVKDRRILLEIAEAWTMRADEAERRRGKSDGQHKGDGNAVGSE